MSSDPEAFVRRVVQLFNALPTDPQERAGSETLCELLDFFDENVEFIQQPNLVGMHDASGRPAFNATWAEWLATWQSQRSEIEEVPRRGNRLLVFSRDRFVARDGLGIDMRGSTIYAVEGGKIVRMQVFGEDHDAAWAAFESDQPPSA